MFLVIIWFNFFPSQEDDKDEAIRAFQQDYQDRTFNLNVEYRVGNISYATLVDPNDNDEDVGKMLIREGLLLCEKRREKRLQKLVSKL